VQNAHFIALVSLGAKIFKLELKSARER